MMWQENIAQAIAWVKETPQRTANTMTALLFILVFIVFYLFGLWGVVCVFLAGIFSSWLKEEIKKERGEA